MNFFQKMIINIICCYFQVYFLYFDSKKNFDPVIKISNALNNFFQDLIEIKFFNTNNEQINDVDRFVTYIIKNKKLIEIKKETKVSSDDIISIFKRNDLKRELEKREKICIIFLL